MWKLPLPTVIDDIDIIKTALTFEDKTKKYEYTESEINCIKKAYKTYEANLGQPCEEINKILLGDSFSNAMHDAYSEVQKTGRLKGYRKAIKDSTLLCPYCGTPSITDIDHHLPRSKYKIFAIYRRNLIPCCHPCNNKKRAIAGESPDEQFPHVYHEKFPAESFLKACVIVKEKSVEVSFYIEKTTNLSQETYERAKNLLKKMELSDRFQNYYIANIAESRLAIETAAQSGKSTFKEYLLKTHIKHRENFGLNDWRTALYLALSDSDDFINGGYIKTLGKITAGA